MGKGDVMSNKLSDLTEQELNIDLKKREFMDKMGKYAIVGAGMATLMTPTASSANNYGTRCGTGKKHHGWKKHHARKNHHRRGRNFFDRWFG